MEGVGTLVIVCVLCLPYLAMVWVLRDKARKEADNASSKKAVFQSALREVI